MKVWIDQDLCTGDGLCEEIAPDVFTLLDDGLAYVKEGDKVYATAKGLPQGAEGLANFPDSRLDAVIESAEEQGTGNDGSGCADRSQGGEDGNGFSRFAGLGGGDGVG